METPSHDPASNVLGPGLNAEDIRVAVSRSGYPLQELVANVLAEQFAVQQEWSYVDTDTNDIRTMDIFAEKYLYDPDQVGDERVYPRLDLLVECKRSDLPYVFFLAPQQRWVRDFPLVAGLPSDEMNVTTDDSPSSWSLGVLDALGLRAHPFAANGPELAFSFSKAVRKGKQIELSGSEPFRDIVLPLTKAMRHFQTTASPPNRWGYFHCSLVLGIAVLDAPMVGVRVWDELSDLTLLPWLRVVRHETERAAHPLRGGRLVAVDMVHKDFLRAYLQDHVLPFAEEFCRLAVKHHECLATGQAFARGMERNWLEGVEERLEPRKMRARLLRLKLTVGNILRVLTGRKPLGE